MSTLLVVLDGALNVLVANAQTLAVGHQPMTKFRPTCVSSVALAACNETDQV
jgi:hypothetical protein